MCKEEYKVKDGDTKILIRNYTRATQNLASDPCLENVDEICPQYVERY